MDEKNNAVDDFLGDLKNNDGDDVFNPQEGEDLFGEGETQTEEEDTEEEKEEKVPFHKDPKVQRYIEKEIAKHIPQKTQEQTQAPIEGDSIDDVLVRLIGNDTPEKVQAVKDFKRVLLEREEKGAEKALQELDRRSQAEAQAEVQAESEIADGFESIEDEFRVDLTSNTPQARKLRGEYIEFIEKIAPKDKNGDILDFPDFTESFRTFQSLRNIQKNNRAKDLAARSMTRTSETSAPPKVNDQSWRGVDAMFSKMFKK